MGSVQIGYLTPEELEQVKEALDQNKAEWITEIGQDPLTPEDKERMSKQALERIQAREEGLEDLFDLVLWHEDRERQLSQPGKTS